MRSRRQCARPAVVFNFLLHMIFTPPVSAASSAILPNVILSSSSARNSFANCVFRISNAFLALSFLTGLALLLVGLFFGDALGEGVPSSSSPESKIINLIFDGDVKNFRGEYWSFHAFTTSGAQNASML